jgi:pimeloyl-ACP methyl ester carboxylesterase
MLNFELSSGDGAELALIHAGICDSSMWDAHWSTLGERYRTLRYDMAGFGNSPLPDESFSNTIDLAEVLAYAGFGETVLVGASMGAKVAVDAALAFPDRIAGLVLVGPAVAGHDWSLEAQAYDELEEAALDQGDLDAAAAINVAYWVDGPQRTPPEVDPELRRRVHEMQRRAFELQIDAVAGLEETPLVPDAAHHLSEISCPALVVVGSIDRVDILEMADQLAAGIPHARRATIEGAAHLPSMERPEEFDELVEAFVDSL